MSKLNHEVKKRSSRLPVDILNFVVISFASAIVIGTLSHLIIEAFSINIGIGLRSLLAALLPIIVITAIRSFVKTGDAQRGEMPFVNIYIIFSILGIIALLTVRFLNEPLIPLGEVLLSFIITSAWLTYNHDKFKAFLARAYGIVSGFLVYIIFFELPL